MASHGGEADSRSTILVVEDHASVRELIRNALEPLESRLLVAGSAAEAVAAAAGEHIDLLVTDVVLPGPTGTDFAAKLRAEQPWVRVIYITGWNDRVTPGDVPDGLLLKKPFALSDLARAVSAALGRDASAFSEDRA